jgi:DNA-binding transcriptional ArsR family regulator
MKTYNHPAVSEVPLTEVMQALSDQCRIDILRALTDAGELSCCEVPLKISKATRSHHFDVLRSAGLILTRGEGTRCMTSVRKEEIDEKFPGLLELVLKKGK